jgi:hypothetical protein
MYLMEACNIPQQIVNSSLSVIDYIDSTAMKAYVTVFAGRVGRPWNWW